MPGTDLLINVLAFLLAIGILVTVHEFGHFWVARRFGIKVLRFSVGFGRPLWRYQGRDGTEYVLASLPLGGYVKMLDEREGEVDPADRPYAYNQQPVGARAAVAAAGPAFNFLFAILAYAVMFQIGVSGISPVVGEVEPDSPAARAGLPMEAEIVAVAGRATPTWDKARMGLLQAAMDDRPVTLTVRTPGVETPQTYELLPPETPILKEKQPDPLAAYGLSPWRPDAPPVLRRVEAGGAADRAGLVAGDVILRADGEALNSVDRFIALVQEHPSEPLDLTIRRDGERRSIRLTPASRTGEGTPEGYIGVGIGADLDAETRARFVAEERYGPLAALGQGAIKTWETSALTIEVLWKLVTGQAHVGHISGPLTIAQYAGATASVGLVAFLGFLGLVSVSLGIINLLPVPILDGGHLLFYAIEWIKGSPLSESAEALGQQIGLTLIVLLMGLALFNDVSRLLG